MPEIPPPSGQFWLLTGEVPAGPFTVAQIHAELANGRATWETAACPVGGNDWRPLFKTPGFGTAAGSPVTPHPAPQDERATTLTANSPPAVSRTDSPGPAVPNHCGPPDTPAEGGRTAGRAGAAIGLGGLVVALALIGLATYGVYTWVRPLTATEVCDRFNEAKTAPDAKKYATPRMYALVDSVYAVKATPDPNVTYELTQEVDGPRPGSRLVGFRGGMFVPEAGRRVQVEGRFVVVKSDGWKVDDAVITGVEGASLPGPLSLVDDHARSTAPASPVTPRSGDWPIKKTGSPPGFMASPPQKPWYEWLDPRKNKYVVYAAVMAAASAVGAVWKRMTARSSPPAGSV